MNFAKNSIKIICSYIIEYQYVKYVQYVQQSTRDQPFYLCFLVRCSGQPIEQKANVKLLGVIFDQHLTRIDQINNIRSTQCTLRVLRKFSRLTPMKVRKTLAEALILSKINYCNVSYGQLPKYLINRFQPIQNTTAGYAYGRYAKTLDI